jgi:hypothetical protein
MYICYRKIRLGLLMIQSISQIPNVTTSSVNQTEPSYTKLVFLHNILYSKCIQIRK